MRKLTVGSMLAFTFALALPLLSSSTDAQAKAAKTGDDSTMGSDKSMSKEDQAKLKEHNKLRAEITKVKYPATKNEVVTHVKGIKADDKKWFEETLPDKTFNSSDDVMTALGWETAPAADKAAKPTKAKASN
jgi:hypothetical protein